MIYFDIDDTLFPSTEFAQKARENAIRAIISQGAPYSFEELYLELMKIVEEKGSNYGKHFDLLCERFDLKPIERYVSASVIAYHSTKYQMAPYPEVYHVLTMLKKKGYKLGVVSQGIPKKQWEKLIRLKLEWMFDNVYITERKSPEFYKTLEKGIVIGDNPETDILYAKIAGHRTIRVKRGKRKDQPSEADYEVKDLREVLSVIERK